MLYLKLNLKLITTTSQAIIKNIDQYSVPSPLMNHTEPGLSYRDQEKALSQRFPLTSASQSVALSMVLLLIIFYKPKQCGLLVKLNIYSFNII